MKLPARKLFSLQTYLGAVMLLAMLPLALLLAYQAATLAATERSAMLAALASIAACVLLGLALVTRAARRISDPLRALAVDSRLQIDGPPTDQAAPVQEIEGLRKALEKASQQQAQTQASLQRQAREFETLIASIPVGLTVLRHGVDPMHSAAMNALFDQGQVLWLDGRPLTTDQHPLRRTAATGQTMAPVELELRDRDDDGTGTAKRHVLMQAAAWPDEAGQALRTLVSAVDITERKTAEQRVLLADRQLQESQRLIDLAQEAGELGFFSVDTQSASWTPGQARLFGFEGRPGSQDYPKTMANLLARIHADDRDRVEQALQAMVAARSERSTLEFRVALPGGGINWLSSRVQMVFGADGQPQHLIGATLNVNEQKGIELERRSLAALAQRARVEAEEANRAKDEFIAMLGHELRNPLGVIGSAAEVLHQLSDGIGINAQVDADLANGARAIIARQTSHLARLVNELLDAGRVISGKAVLDRQRIDLPVLMQRVLDNFRAAGGLDKHKVQLTLEPVCIEADSTRMEQVINNLLGNALKYTPAGRCIELSLRASQGLAVLQVRDEGNGISQVLLPHVFDLFVQGERSLDRSTGGLGMGLTLVRRLVEMHGGTVTAESSSAGSLFTVSLPALPASTASTGIAADGATALDDQRPCRVLVIEDNDDARDTLRTLLELDGHSVITAGDGLDGLSLLLGDAPDVAIVDIGLPGLNGFELAKRGRQAGYSGQMLALSGYSGDTDVAKALRNGFDAHMAKPVDSERLRELMSVGIKAREQV